MEYVYEIELMALALTGRANMEARASVDAASMGAEEAMVMEETVYEEGMEESDEEAMPVAQVSNFESNFPIPVMPVNYL